VSLYFPQRYGTCLLTEHAGLDVVQVRLIFCSHHQRAAVMASDKDALPTILAYVENFKLDRVADSKTQLFRATRNISTQGQRSARIVKLDHIVQPCSLGPRFGEVARDLNCHSG
jgi:hypothetical protein